MVTPRSPLRQGGVERHVLEVSSRIASRGAHVEVLCADPGGAALDQQWRDGVAIRSVRAWPANRDWCVAPGIWTQIARADWDVIHVQSYHTFVAPLAMLRALALGIPYCVTFHGGGHSSRIRNRLRTAQMLLLRPLLARATALVALARFEIDLYSRVLRLPAERFELIPNGTELGPVPVPAAVEIDAAPGPVLASIGRLERYKGHHRVLAALPHVLAVRPDASLLIVGTGPEESALRRQADAMGLAERVRVTSVPAGDGAAMARLLGGVSVVVLMSDFETHPLVALEAAAAGRRLVVADRAGLHELAEDGLARAIEHGASAQLIADAILEELGKPPPTARPRVISWDECAERLLELYCAVASR
jgi:glycogen synthase